MQNEMISTNKLLIALARNQVSMDEIFEMIDMHAKIIDGDNKEDFVENIRVGLEMLQTSIDKKYFEGSMKKNSPDDNESMNEKDLYNRKEVIKMLGISEKTFYNYAKDGLKVCKANMGRKIFVYKTDLDEFLKRRNTA
jgi:hypothetical protein